MDYVKITDNVEEMIEIGKKIVETKGDIYTSKMIDVIMAKIKKQMSDADANEQEEALYRAIYDYWVYGNNIGEEFYLYFRNKTHKEKNEFVTFRNRYLYTQHLNKNADASLLQDKYQAYEKLKPYYMRDVIEIAEEKDFGIFCEFVKKHPIFVVKPTDLGLAIGVHKEDLSDCNDLRNAFDQILQEGKNNIHNYKWGKKSSVVLEELIVQSKVMADFHPQSVNSVRVTAVRVDNKIHIWYPWLKIGVNGGFVTSAAFDTLDAGIDAKTGIVNTDAFDENCNVFEKHPNTNIKFKGFQIPRWDELLETINCISDIIPEFGYVGWDMVLTDKGWVVMEGNVAGEFMGQLMHGYGVKKEFEQLINWKPEKEFWWQK